jgi:hypothetical protein
VLEIIKGLLESGKLVDDWREAVLHRATDQRASVRMLYLETLHNLEILEHFRLDGSGDTPSTDRAYLHAANALQIEAHEQVLLTQVADRREAKIVEVHERARLAKLEEIEDQLRVPIVVISESNPELELLEARLAPEGPLAQELRELRDGRKVTLLQALAFVTTKTRALRSMAALPEEAEPVRRQLRIAVRLRNIQAYERKIRDRLTELDAVGDLVPRA